MVVQRVMRAGLQTQDSGVRLGGTFLARMEQHLAGLARPADRLPFQLVAMADLHRLMLGEFRVSGHGSPLCAHSCRIELRTLRNLSIRSSQGVRACDTASSAIPTNSITTG